MNKTRFDVEDILLHARARLKALEFLFSQAQIEISIDPDVTVGLGYMVGDVLELLEPLNELPLSDRIVKAGVK